jgi:hypothetical protein
MRAIRILTVGLGVTLACIVAGAVAGMLCLAVVGLIDSGPRAFSDVGMEVFGYAALVGGLCGLLVGPAAAFGFLRRVPLGRLFAETTLGATLGGLLGFVLNVNDVLFFGLPVAGFAVAVAHLAWRYRATHEPADRALAD